MVNMSVPVPTNMEWTVVPNCVCADGGAVCVRPIRYAKPVECVRAEYAGNISAQLLSGPCANNTIVETVCCDGSNVLMIVAVMFVFCLFQVGLGNGRGHSFKSKSENAVFGWTGDHLCGASSPPPVAQQTPSRRWGIIR